MELELVKFIREHSDWEKLLQEKPYCLLISRDEMFGRKLVLFKYSQIDSDFSNEIVKESRGIILEEDTWKVVCYPFRKFMNYGEPTADEIDWNSVCITEKIDGSLIKIVNMGGGQLLISTNGTIDAFKAPIPEQIGCKYASFGELVRKILDDSCWSDDSFKEGFTYMFELVSPWTRVVIPYAKAELYFLGCRDNKTFQEQSFNVDYLQSYFKTPRVFSFKTFDECIQNAAELPWNEEGYVVNDKFFHRVKVKSVAWIQIHHIKDNGNLSYARCLELIRMNEVGEVLNYFPEFKDEFDRIQEVYDKSIRQDESAWDDFMDKFVDPKQFSRKELALWITSRFKIPGIGFSMLDGKVKSVRDWYEKCSIDSLVKYLGFK